MQQMPKGMFIIQDSIEHIFTSWFLDNRFWVLQIVPIPNVTIFKATTAKINTEKIFDLSLYTLQTFG